MSNKTRDLLCGILFLAVGAFMFQQSLGIEPIIAKEVGSGFVPKVIASVFICLSVLLVVLTLLKPHKTESVAKNEDIKGGVVTIAMLAAYVLLFDKLGFILSSALYLFAQILIFSNDQNRKLPLFGAIAVVTPVVIYFLFVKAFELMLPAGILPF